MEKNIHSYQPKARFLLRGDWSNYLTFPEEKLLLIRRKHWVTLLPNFLLTGLLVLFFVLLAVAVFFIILSSPRLFIASSLTVLCIALFIIGKTIVDWYFYLYVVTTHRILEVRCTPLSLDMTNEVLLSQVRCTEIDIKKAGLIREIINYGDITLTFDRPTHQEEFVLADIADPAAIGSYLTTNIVNTMNQYGSPIWFRSNDRKRPYHFTEEVYSR